jgi:hypothetical protein
MMPRLRSKGSTPDGVGSRHLYVPGTGALEHDDLVAVNGAGGVLGAPGGFTAWVSAVAVA